MSPLVSSEILLAAKETAIQCSHTGERYIFEFIATITGLKSVVRVQVADNAEYLLLKQFAQIAHLAIVHSPTRMKVAWTNSLGDTFLTAVPWDDPDGTSFAAYLGKNLVNAEKAALIESEGTAEEIGTLLGYPRCCCIAYERLESGEFWAPVLAENSLGSHFKPWANRFAYLLYGTSLFPDYFPCSLSCTGTHKLGVSFYEMAIVNNLAELAEVHLNHIKRPIIVGNGFIAGFSSEVDSENADIGLVVHEWINGSSTYLPSNERLINIAKNRNSTLQMMDDSTARIIYFDQ